MPSTKPKKIKNLAKKYISEYFKCKNSFNYFCSNYIYLELPGKDELFKPYTKQIELIDAIELYKYILVLKSRQIGISTIIQAYAAWLAVFFDNVVIGIISKDGNEATDFARIVRGFIDKLPKWIKPQGGFNGRGFAKRTERSFILTNGSKTYASPVNPKSPSKTLRGKAITFLIIDEAAFVDYVSEAWTSIVPALSTSQLHAKKNNVPYGTIILSTPNKTVGKGKWYFERYVKSISNDDIFKPFIIHWKMIPELANDPDWYNTQCALFDYDKRRIAQELELKFLPTEGSFFEINTIEDIQNSYNEPEEKIKLYNGEIWKFDPPNKDSYYLIGVDTASEYGQDKSAISIFDYETLEQVWEYQGKCRVLDFIKVVIIAITEYPGLLVIESNSYGNQVIEHLNNGDYSSMLYKEKRGEKIYPGLSNNAKTRPLMIDALYSYITQYPNIVKSQRFALELTGLVTSKVGKVEAESGCRDDIALASACAFYVRKYDPPLLIDKHKYSTISNELLDIIDMNISKPNVLNNKKLTNYIKNEINNNNINNIRNFSNLLSLKQY
jgi:hypothetical protein